MPTYEWYIRSNGIHIDAPDLELYWELDGSAMSDNYFYDEADEFDLWSKWIRDYPGPEMSIYWAVRSTKAQKGERAPFLGYDHDFLTYYTWPTDVETGEELNWLTLPVPDKHWSPGRCDKGGFIQQVTGWKPSPLQRTADLRVLARAAGLYYPSLEEARS